MIIQPILLQLQEKSKVLLLDPFNGNNKSLEMIIQNDLHPNLSIRRSDLFYGDEKMAAWNFIHVELSKEDNTIRVLLLMCPPPG